MSRDFFPSHPDVAPKIYAYRDTNPQYAGLLKVGFTSRDAQKRVAQQYPTLRPGALPYEIVLEESAMRNDGSVFVDHDVHRYLRRNGIKNLKGEWFKCSVKDVRAAVIAVRNNELNEENRSIDFKMRPEQAEAVEKTAVYFKGYKKE
ncbi:MAG: GIY-YIG nuclease family protein, partial [Pontiellaceae bacterium]|nr:GIY-YIG nuclease family protein [Pontiellaceae bacterium]